MKSPHRRSPWGKHRCRRCGRVFAATDPNVRLCPTCPKTRRYPTGTHKSPAGYHLCLLCNKVFARADHAPESEYVCGHCGATIRVPCECGCGRLFFPAGGRGPKRFATGVCSRRWTTRQPTVRAAIAQKAKVRLAPGTPGHAALVQMAAWRSADPDIEARRRSSIRRAWATNALFHASHTGVNHWAWRADKITGRGSMWHEAREAIRQRDGNACRLCGRTKVSAPKGYLVVHHIRAFQGDEARDNEPSNLITLCRRCHLSVERGYGDARERLSRL